MADLIVVTGGSYSGKTAVIDALAARGHEVLPEAAYEVIDEVVREHGLDGQAAWRRENLVEFQRRITLRQHERERRARRAATRFVFCDRGLLDGLAYCRLSGVDWPDDLAAAAADATYAHVFVLSTLPGFDPRHETGRMHTHEDSVRVAALIEDVYRGRSPGITLVPHLTVPERVEMVLRTIGAE